MTPQLYINYKLKSVEHLPWRVMVYKFLNTIVDDFAVFLITMPWLKRLSCFRDGIFSLHNSFLIKSFLDIIFIIYLYQRWIYRVDKNRDVNCFIIITTINIFLSLMEMSSRRKIPLLLLKDKLEDLKPLKLLLLLLKLKVLPKEMFKVKVKEPSKMLLLKRLLILAR